jgi:hypothetical protein
MSTLTTHTTATRATPSGSNIGLCKFNTTSNAIEVSDGTNWQIYNSDGASLKFLTSTYSASFDGIDDRIIVPQSSDLNINGSMSISFWFQRGRAGHTSFEGVLNKNAGSSVNYSVGFRSSSDSLANKLAFWDGTGGSGAGNLPTNTAFTSTTDIVHACFVNNGGTWYWYINGVEDNTGTGVNITSTTTDLVLGAYDSSSPSLFYKGNLDEVFIWSRALSESEVSNIYNYKIYLSDSLAAGWRLENDATDSINSNDGTNNGATLDSGGLY